MPDTPDWQNLRVAKEVYLKLLVAKAQESERRGKPMSFSAFLLYLLELWAKT